MSRVRSQRLFVIAGLCTALGCHAEGEGGSFDFGQTTGTGGTTAPTGTSSGSTSTSGSGSGESSSSGGSSSSSSTGADESSSGGLPTEPCTGLDILVVIDNSDTMAEEQAKLGMALSPFIAQLNEQLPGIVGSIQVGVITTDAPQMVVANPTMTCTPYASGTNWMSFGPTLATELACASAVGTMGDPDERPMQMAIESLGVELVGDGGFNEGFLREGAPLLLLILSDEEDDFEAITEWGSQGDPADWVDALAATQGGYVQNVIPLALVGTDPPNACPPFQWDGVTGAEIATRIAEFVDAFPHGGVGDICAAEYMTFLGGAVADVVAACNAHVPE
ncbi:MAG: hypothetical protein K1X88_02255 [Nannocystaceae bacterium]|nr:hypothetical protein [Nannocystaceae bacterium]